MNLKSITVTAAACALAAGGSAAIAAGGGGSGDSSTDKPRSAQCERLGGRMHLGGPLRDVAAAIGISPAELREQLADGRKLSEIASANDKSLDEVKAAVRASLDRRLDRLVEADRITQAQADQRLDGVGRMIDDIEAGRRPTPPAGTRRGGPGMFGPPGGPAASAPGTELPSTTS